MLPWLAGAQSVAWVTDLQGRATITVSGEQRPLAILGEIPANARIQVAPEGRLVAVYNRSGEEYTFSGPSAATFADSGLEDVAGARPARKASPLERGKGIRIRPASVTQATIVLRSARNATRLRLLTLAGTRTLDTTQEFRWVPLEGALGYQYTLLDATGRTLLEVNVMGDSYRLPAAVKLEEGASYTWELSTRLPDGRRYAASGDFTVVRQGEREEVETLRPAADAPLAERIAFAAWLEQQELRDEARRYWRAAAAERPEEARLRQLGGE